MKGVVVLCHYEKCYSDIDGLGNNFFMHCGQIRLQCYSTGCESTGGGVDPRVGDVAEL